MIIMAYMIYFIWIIWCNNRYF